jgi:hypothetical protein
MLLMINSFVFLLSWWISRSDYYLWSIFEYIRMTRLSLPFIMKQLPPCPKMSSMNFLCHHSGTILISLQVGVSFILVSWRQEPFKYKGAIFCSEPSYAVKSLHIEICCEYSSIMQQQALTSSVFMFRIPSMHQTMRPSSTSI